MAMLRSSLGRVVRRLRGSSAVPSVMCQRGPEIPQAPSLPSVYPTMTWVLPLGPQLMRTFASPATAAASSGHTRRISNLQVQRHFPVFSNGIESMKLAGQKGFFSTGKIQSVLERVEMWMDETIKPHHMMILVGVIGLSSFVATTIAYRRLSASVERAQQ